MVTRKELNTKTIALIIAFAALAIALNPAITGMGVPFPPITGLIYNLWEIVIIAAFLLMGFKSGISIALINALFLFAVFPGPSRPMYPLNNTAAILSTLTGIFIVNRLTNRGFQKENIKPGVKSVAFATGLAILFRVVVMAPLMYVNAALINGLPTPVVLGFVLPLQAVFNVTLLLYAVPVGYLIAGVINRNLTLSKGSMNEATP